MFVIMNNGIEVSASSIKEGINHMANDLNAMLAIHNFESGISISMLRLSTGESLTLEDEMERK